MIKKKIMSLVLAVAMSTAFFMPAAYVQAVPVSQQYINNNRSYQPLVPVGLEIHDTDNAGATAQNNRDYFNRVYVGASAHFFIDWTTTIQCIPNSEVAWHAGPTANHKYISLEMCMPKGHDVAKFNEVYQNTVELAASICKQYSWNANNIVSHYWTSMTWHETDHEDPMAFLQEYGKSWNDLLNDIQRAINGQAAVITQPAEPNNNVERASKFIGSRCKELQEKLIACGYNCGGYGADGQFSKGTYNSLIAFQKDNNLQVDGLAGNATFSKLNILIADKNKPAVKVDSWTTNLQRQIGANADGIPGPQTLSLCPTVQYGNEGATVKILQQKLNALGYNTNGVDGLFYNGTKNAVKQFQRNKGLESDGIVGKQTWRVLLGL